MARPDIDPPAAPAQSSPGTKADSDSSAAGRGSTYSRTFAAPTAAARSPATVARAPPAPATAPPAPHPARSANAALRPARAVSTAPPPASSSLLHTRPPDRTALDPAPPAPATNTPRDIPRPLRAGSGMNSAPTPLLRNCSASARSGRSPQSPPTPQSPRVAARQSKFVIAFFYFL